MADINNEYPTSEPVTANLSKQEMELLELQEANGLQMLHKSKATAEFPKQVPVKLSSLLKIRSHLSTMFRKIYSCMSIHSVLKFSQNIMQFPQINTSQNFFTLV